MTAFVVCRPNDDLGGCARSRTALSRWNARPSSARVLRPDLKWKRPGHEGLMDKSAWQPILVSFDLGGRRSNADSRLGHGLEPYSWPPKRDSAVSSSTEVRHEGVRHGLPLAYKGSHNYHHRGIHLATHTALLT